MLGIIITLTEDDKELTHATAQDFKSAEGELGMIERWYQANSGECLTCGTKTTQKNSVAEDENDLGHSEYWHDSCYERGKNMVV